MGIKNTLTDLNNHLFAEIERLSDEDLQGEQLMSEIDRAKAVSTVAQHIIANGKLALEAEQFKSDYSYGNLMVRFRHSWKVRVMRMHKYTQEEKDYLAEIVPGKSRKEIVELFNNRFGTNIDVKVLASAYKRFGFSTGRTGFFEKGSVPANKGKPMPPEMYEKAKATMFKKGSLPQNHKPVGTESIRSRKNRENNTYIWVKVAEPNIWRMKQLLVWEKHHGKVPRGQIVTFLDGDHMNCEINNLTLIDKATNARLNQSSLRFNDKELTEAGISTAKLLTAIGEAKRRRKRTVKNC